MKTKNELIELSKVYFENNEIGAIYATTDCNFFYENSKNLAYNHTRKNADVKVFLITREDIAPKKEVVIEEPVKEVKTRKKKTKK